MDHGENHFFIQNKFLEDRIEQCLHSIETRLDKLHRIENNDDLERASSAGQHRTTNPYSSYSLMTFKAPYIRDFRNFSSPINEDARQIQRLNGEQDITTLAKNKCWSKEAKQQLHDAVLDHYAKIHIVKLIKQKNNLLELPSNQNNQDVVQKLRLIDEQMEQARTRKEPRIFVPEDRTDSQIDWCAISAKLTSQHDAQDCRLMWTNESHWTINNNHWTKDEDICLINAVAKHGRNNWEKVAEELNSNRLAWQCCSRYNQEYAFISTPIEKDDVDKIIEVINLCRIGSYVPWNQVMYFVRYYNLNQVKYQWQKYCSEKKASASWTNQEDLLLMDAVARYGEKDWCRIAELVPGRSNKSCRERYTMRLKYRRRIVGCWRPREDQRLLSLTDELGTNWSLIATYLPERNCHQLRNRYELLKNDCNRIGPIKHRRLYRNSSCQLVGSTRRQKTPSENEVNQKLSEIFSTYQSISKISSRGLVCRSAQDEMIHQSLVRVLADTFLGRVEEKPILETIIDKSIRSHSGLFAPSIPTLRGFKAWSLQQDYLKQMSQNVDISEVDPQILRIVVSLFLWPAILQHLKSPQLNPADYQVRSLIERDSRNLYKIRSIQSQLTR